LRKIDSATLAKTGGSNPRRLEFVQGIERIASRNAGPHRCSDERKPLAERGFAYLRSQPPNEFVQSDSIGGKHGSA
jgi:hypothetical protein